MARRPRASKLENRTNRLTLPIRRKPVYVTVAPGIAIGYRRNRGAGSWTVRAADGHGGRWTKAIAIADDHEEADGKTVLTFWQAQDAARKLARKAEESGRPVTVGEALDHYGADLRAREGDAHNVARVRLHLPPSLVAKTVALLTARDLRAWRDGLAAKGLSSATVNRTVSVLRAALNLARRDDARISDAAWRTALARLPDSERARNVVLSDAVIRDIVAAAHAFDPTLGTLFEVLAVTGCRTSQALRLVVRDLQTANGDPRLMVPGSRKGARRRPLRHQPAPIPASLALRLRQLAAGRADDALLFDPAPRHPSRAFQRVTATLQLPVGATLYSFRHSSITRMLLRGIPTRLVAAHHDTSTLMIERTYAHCIADHGDALVRGALLDVEQTPLVGNVVVPLKG